MQRTGFFHLHHPVGPSHVGVSIPAPVCRSEARQGDAKWLVRTQLVPAELGSDRAALMDGEPLYALVLCVRITEQKALFLQRPPSLQVGSAGGALAGQFRLLSITL